MHLLRTDGIGRDLIGVEVKRELVRLQDEIGEVRAERSRTALDPVEVAAIVRLDDVLLERGDRELADTRNAGVAEEFADLDIGAVRQQEVESGVVRIRMRAAGE